MKTIKFNFPVKKDAYLFRAFIKETITGSFLEKEEQLSISAIDKLHINDRDIWQFKVCLSGNEKTIEISGGTLDLVNKGKQVWAFSHE